MRLMFKIWLENLVLEIPNFLITFSENIIA